MSDQYVGFLDRTLARVRDRWLASTRGAKTAGLKPNLAPDLPDADLALIRHQIDACLERHGGEVSARRRAADLGRAYLELSDAGRARFLALLAHDYGVDSETVDGAMLAVREADSADARRRAEAVLRAALVAPRIALLRQFNDLEDGVKFLVNLRRDLAPLKRDDADFGAFDGELRELLAGWFDIGFLDLRRISWQAPADLLEKLIAYEAVHQIRSWDDLKNRLDSDRRCYAFFHPRMPDEPLIFVEIALVKGMAGTIHDLLDETAPAEDPATADTAIFYSISNCQPGLAGVSFGDFLIKRVVDSLTRDFPNLKTFATLSPLPDFRTWLAANAADPEVTLLGETEARLIGAIARNQDGDGALLELLDVPDWPNDPDLARELEPPLLRLAARYLLSAKRGARAYDRVAHFHLTNGARVERLNWAADLSATGLAQSAGIMVNYRYKLGDIDRNHETYRGDAKVMASAAVRKLAKA